MSSDLSTAFEQDGPADSPVLAGYRAPFDRPETIGLLVVVALVFTGNALLSSAASGGWQPGMRPWADGSWLQPVVDLLNLNGAQPTQRGVEIKSLIFRLGACAAATIAALAWLGRLMLPLLRRPPATAAAPEQSVAPNTIPRSASLTARGVQGRPFDPAALAQLLLMGYLLWSAFSCGWSSAPRQAAGYAATVLVLPLGAIALGRRLSPVAARVAAGLLIATGALAATSGLIHHYVRSPDLRLAYPIGNPLPFGALLIVGILIAGAALIGQLAPNRQQHGTRPPLGDRWRWLATIALTVAIAAMISALALTKARGAAIGLAAGLVAIGGVCLARRSWRQLLIGATIAIVALAIAAYFVIPASGRRASVNFRGYAWRYAVAMFARHPTGGDGGGTYSRLAPQLAAADRWADPGVLTGQLVMHAHNEWLEVLADLGLTGLILWGGCWAMTVAALVRSWWRSRRCGSGWLILGLLGAMVALGVEEATEVGLRMPGLPAVAATLLGLSWAVCRAQRGGHDQPRVARGLVAVVVILAMCAVGIRVAWADWRASRHCYDAIVAFNRQHHDRAEKLLAQAVNHRVDPARRLMIVHYQMEIARKLAEQLIDRAHATAEHQPAQRGAMLDQAAQAIDRGLAVGEYLERVAPGFAFSRPLMATLFELRAEVATARNDPQRAAGARAEVARWLVLAWNGRRGDSELAGRLVEYMDLRDMQRVVGVLRDGLRLVPVSGRLRQVLAQVSGQPDCDQGLAEMLAEAEVLAEAPRPAKWIDKAVPETLRLAGLVAGLRQQLERSGQLAGMAAGLYDKIGTTFDAAHATALSEKAWSEFLADPHRARRAVDSARAALAALTDNSVRSAPARRVRQDLVLYLLAAGDQADAAEQMQLLQTALPPQDRQNLNEVMRQGWRRLVELFSRLEPDQRPKSFAKWLERSTSGQ